MIDHSNCDHPSTSGARAKCRRASGGSPTKTRKATPKVVDEGDRYGQTPGRREDECHKCGVERIEYSGTDPITGIVLYVGARCRYYIKGVPDEKAVI